jgi:hypothetical protein
MMFAAQYKEFLSKIQELADSTVNESVKSAPAAQGGASPYQTFESCPANDMKKVKSSTDHTNSQSLTA